MDDEAFYFEKEKMNIKYLLNKSPKFKINEWLSKNGVKYFIIWK